jgi:hypothetical protein
LRPTVGGAITDKQGAHEKAQQIWVFIKGQKDSEKCASETDSKLKHVAKKAADGDGLHGNGSRGVKGARELPEKNPAKAAGLSLPNVESDLLQGVLPIRLEVIRSTWRCKQKRDVRVLMVGEGPAADRLRPGEPTQHCRVHP